LDRTGHVASGDFRLAVSGHSAGRPPVRAHHPFLRHSCPGALSNRAPADDLPVRILEAHSRDDHGRLQGGFMNGPLSRRKWITPGLAATAGLSGLAVASRLAAKYGLIPPDCGGLYGPGTTLTYASQRLLTRHSLAREFPRSRISKAPFAN